MNLFLIFTIFKSNSCKVKYQNKLRMEFKRTKRDASPENNLRLLMIYASVYLEKFEGDKASKLMQDQCL